MPSPRVQALLDVMTDAELVSCCHASSYFAAGGVPRLGIVALNMADGPLGVRPQQRPGQTTPEAEMQCTAFPASLSLAATFDPALAQAVGTVMGAEARHWDIHILLAPGVNNLRTPLCGRNFEYLGEDPLLTARLAVGLIRGIQAQGVAACVKHLAGNTQELARKSVDVHADERTLREIELPPFLAAVRDAGVWTVMGAYNRLRGQWCCQHAWLLGDLLRREWGFDGLVVSDWNSLNSTWEAAWNGLDVEMGTPRPFDEFHLARPFREGLATGIFPRALAEQKAGRFLSLQERLGLLPGQTRPGPGRGTCPEHQALARTAAAQAMVLLKNDGVLPLSPPPATSTGRPWRIAIIGDNATTPHCRSGGSSALRPPHEIVPLEALRRRLAGVEIIHERGYPDLALAMPAFAREQLGSTGLAGGLTGWKREIFANPSPSPSPGAPVSAEPVSAETVGEIRLVPDQRPVGIAAAANEWMMRWTTTLTPTLDGEHVIITESVHGHGVIEIDGRRCGKIGLAPVPVVSEATVRLRAGVPVQVLVQFNVRNAGAALRIGLRQPGWRAEGASDLRQRAVAAARAADLVLYLGGLSHGEDTEDQDRSSYGLPHGQDDLIAALADANPNLVAVLWGGNPFSMPWLPRVRAALLAWYPGMEGGEALADVLTGAVDPGGRLPFSWPARLEDSPAHALDDYRAERVEHREGIFTGYRWFDQRGIEPLFPFGHGLSYTRFEIRDLDISPEGGCSVTVTNRGERSGRTVVQCYIAPPVSRWPRPPQELKAFQAVELAVGASRRLTLELGPDAFAHWCQERRGWHQEPGKYTIAVGFSSRDLPLRGYCQRG